MGQSLHMQDSNSLVSVDETSFVTVLPSNLQRVNYPQNIHQLLIQDCVSVLISSCRYDASNLQRVHASPL
jgi:hypothetical protein